MDSAEIETLLARAAEHGQREGKTYAGDLTPKECHVLWQALPGSRLIDVRTQPEIDFVGLVPNACHVPWQIYPDMRVNPHFLEEVQRLAGPEDYLFFLCRSGARSTAAATFMAAQGYARCFNVLQGFEGNKDATGRRGVLEGWKAAGLPWVNV